MNRPIILLIILSFVASGLSGQENSFQTGSEFCSLKKKNGIYNPAKPLGYDSVDPHSFDVLNYKLDVNLYACYSSPYSHLFSGKDIITFKVDSTLGSIILNAANSSLIVDSVGLAAISFTHSDNYLTLQLDRVYNPGEVVSVKVNYTHKNFNDNAFYVKNGFVFTDCEPEGARKWFPCWDKPSDKATFDLTAKVPATVKLGSNGIIADSTRIADTIWYHWVSNQNVATYLMVITSKVNYNLDILYWHKLSNPTDSIPIRFYYNQGENPAPVKNKILAMTDWFSQKYIEHPFDKNGFASLNDEFVWGGMENQTLTSLCPNCWYEGLAAHEFAHQWFGDMITCGTWADIWLNEGFATWSECFWYESYQGYSGYKSVINSYANDYVNNNPGFPISMPSWATHTPPSDTLFNWYITYAKGASVLHQLRYVLGDSIFFNTLQAYSGDTNLKFKSATISDFAQKANQVSGEAYQWFFDEWIFQPNHPVYQNTYNFQDIGSGQWKVNLFVSQTQSDPPFFKMPIEIKIIFNDLSDTIFRVMNDNNYQQFSWTYNKKPVIFLFDPLMNIVLKEGGTVVGIQPATRITDKMHLLQNYPNPVTDKTNIVFEIDEPMHVKLEIRDIIGKEVLHLIDEFKGNGKYSYEIDCSSLDPGIYFYTLNADGETQTRKLIIK